MPSTECLILINGKGNKERIIVYPEELNKKIYLYFKIRKSIMNFFDEQHNYFFIDFHNGQKISKEFVYNEIVKFSKSVNVKLYPHICWGIHTQRIYLKTVVILDISMNC